VQKGVRQGYILSPYQFNIFAENIMTNVRNSNNSNSFDALKVGEIEIPELRYADDTVLPSQNTKGLHNLITSVKKHSEDQNLFLNIQKTKIMSTDKSKTTTQNCHTKERD
jgi:hypothetical protein